MEFIQINHDYQSVRIINRGSNIEVESQELLVLKNKLVGYADKDGYILVDNFKDILRDPDFEFCGITSHERQDKVQRMLKDFLDGTPIEYARY